MRIAIDFLFSFDLRAGLLDHLRPFRDFAAEECGELAGRGAGRLGAERPEAGANLGDFQDPADPRRPAVGPPRGAAPRPRTRQTTRSHHSPAPLTPRAS